MHVPFPDGAYLTQYHDIDRTCDEFAKFSKKDAAAYRRMIAEYDAVKPIFDAVSYTPIGWGKPVNERLAEHPDGKRWLRRIAMSGWDIIRDNFEDDHCRAFMLWMAFQTVVPPEWPMSGRLAYSLVYGRQRWSWCVPKGGSGAFSGALARLVEAHGGVILTNKRVRALIVEHGRCTGVECADGSAYRAGKAVLSTHSHQASRRHGAARDMGRGFRRRRGDVASRSDPVRHALCDHRADAIRGRWRRARADGRRHAVDGDPGACAWATTMRAAPSISKIRSCSRSARRSRIRDARRPASTPSR